MRTPFRTTRGMRIGCLLAITAFTAFGLFGLCGCKDTDVLKEIVYDQTASILENDQSLAIWKYDPDSKLESNKVSESDSDTKKGKTNNLLPRALYSSKASKAHTAAQFTYAKDAKYNCESTDTVTYVYDEKADKRNDVDPKYIKGNKKEKTSEKEQKPNERQKQKEEGDQGSSGDSEGNNEPQKADKRTADQGDKNTKKNATGVDAKEKKSKEDPEDKHEDKPKKDKENEAPKIDPEGGDDSKTDGKSPNEDIPKTPKKAKTYKTSSTYAAPECETAVAYGPYAVAIQMVAGEGVLVGTAANYTKDGSEFQAVFSDEGADKLKKVWSGDGADSFDNDEFDRLIKLEPDAVVLGSSDGLTDAQKEKIGEIGAVIITGDMSSDAAIKKTMLYFAKVFGKSPKKADSELDSTQVAKDYADWVDKTVAEVEDANGGYNASLGDRNAILDNSQSRDKVVSSKDTKYTLLIDGWENASYKKSIGGFKPDVSNGIGMVTVGYTHSPVSYYLGSGGAVNVAAVLNFASRYNGRQAVAWQYSYSALSPNPSSWSTDIGFKLAETKHFFTVPITGLDTGVTGEAKDISKSPGLGSESYPAVIVTDKKMKKAFVNSAIDPDGAYYPNDVVTDGSNPAVGRRCGTHLLDSDIGRSHAATSSNLYTSDKSELKERIENIVLVNPKGLLCSWTNGSPESFLEAPWLSSTEAYGSYISESQLEGYLEDFYKTFYRYDEISGAELSEALSGEEG